MTSTEIDVSGCKPCQDLPGTLPSSHNQVQQQFLYYVTVQFCFYISLISEQQLHNFQTLSELPGYYVHAIVLTYSRQIHTFKTILFCGPSDCPSRAKDVYTHVQAFILLRR